jgi:hypothetical protein
MMPLTWHEKMSRPHDPKRRRLDKPFAGVSAGAMLYISTPREIDVLIGALPEGETLDVPELRRRLAEANNADATCPTTTAIFLRIVAEAALDQIGDGADWADVTPFWRAIDPDGPIAGRLSCGRDMVRNLRLQESG